MVSYKITAEILKKFQTKGLPFMSFDQYNNVVQMFRDEHYAAKNIENFTDDVGTQYNLWTVDTHNRYSRNLFFDQITKPLLISMQVPHIDSNATFPLMISIYDEDGEYFNQEQRIAVQRVFMGKTRPTSWRKVETLCDFVLNEFQDGKITN